MHDSLHAVETDANVMSIGSWKLDFNGHTEVMSGEAVEQSIELLSRWERIFPGGNTYVAREHGVPSLAVRLDCTVDADGKLHVFEVEERPCGFGLTRLCNPAFAERVDSLRTRWPEFRWVASDTRPTDDELWLGPALSVSEAHEYSGNLLLRGRPEEEIFHQFEHRAVSSVSCEGDKAYGVALGLWHRIEYVTDGEEGWLTPQLPEACVLKPLQGTRSRLVKVYMSNAYASALRARGYSVSSRELESARQLEKLVSRQPERAMYCQPFILPMQLSHLPAHNMIYRMFFGFDPSTREWKPLHGVWMALDAFVVHGTNKTITGPLLSAV